MHPAIFLDRDGVIIENLATYVRTWEDVKWIPGALEGLISASASPYKIIIVTNQSAVGRGILTLEQAWEINHRLVRSIVQAGGRIDGIYMCPHAPLDNCSCRKPEPGLLLQAASELSLDLPRSILIGDAISDLQAGQAAGLRQTILVRSGRGREQELLALSLELGPFQIFDNLVEALQLILSKS
jgi:D-glycero-D-manno-heptose 1,7-bisphosphate phosphatase